MLLSWAVPKGPAIDPTVKRLAMHVEDHPVEYGEFEGVIPSGYGAGIVMLWDRGTWTPEVDDVDAALAKGDLKMTLDGYKLKGSWVLVRTRGWGSKEGKADDGRSWLLIKHKDEWAGPIDIAEFAPLSVKSGGDFAEILSADDPDIWRSNRPAEGGETGKMFDSIIKRALAMRAGGARRPRPVSEARRPRQKAKGKRQKEEAGESRKRQSHEAEAGSPSLEPEHGCGVLCSSRWLNTDHTANDRRRRSWRAIAVVQNGPVTSSMSPSSAPTSSGSFCSAA